MQHTYSVLRNGSAVASATCSILACAFLSQAFLGFLTTEKKLISFLVQEGYLAMNFLLKALSCCLLAVIDWCCVILMEFCLAPLFDCYVVILMIGRIRKELLLHLVVVHLKAVAMVTD
jgi:hypothetical protein